MAYVLGMVSYQAGYYSRRESFRNGQRELVARILQQYGDYPMFVERLMDHGAPQRVLNVVADVEAERTPRDTQELADFMRAAVLLNGSVTVADQLEYQWQLMRTLWALAYPVVCLAAGLCALGALLWWRQGMEITALASFSAAALAFYCSSALRRSRGTRSRTQTEDVIRYFLALAGRRYGSTTV